MKQFILSGLALLIVSLNATAQSSWHIDSTFGNNGFASDKKTKLNIKKRISVFTESDGAVTAIIAQVINSIEPLILMRFNPAGNPDSTFGVNGQASVNHADAGVFETGNIVKTPAGYLMAGTKFEIGSTFFLAAKIKNNGMMDAAFGTGGKVKVPITTPSGTWAHVPGLADIQSDGKILLGGGVANPSSGGAISTVAHCRLQANGALDATYGVAGILMNPFPILHEYPGCSSKRLIVQPDDKLVIATSRKQHAASYPVVVRYHPDGTPDSSFGTNGLTLPLTAVVSGDYEVYELEMDAAGNLYMIMRYNQMMVTSIRIIKLSGDGALISSYGSGGTAVVNTFQLQYAHMPGTAMQPDGKLLISGTIDTGAVSTFGVFRLNADGTPDSSFGTDGLFVISRGQRDVCHSVAVQPDSSIILSGYTITDPDSSRPFVVRIKNTWTPTAIPAASTQKAIKIYPNPAGETIIVSGVSKGSVAITNLPGQAVMQFVIEKEQQQLDVRGLPAGVYFLRVTTPEGGVMVQKFLKE